MTEDFPRFHDTEIVYLSSGKKIINDQNILFKEIIPILNCDKNKSNISDSFLTLANSMALHFNEIYSKFSDISYSSDDILSISIDSCQIIFLDAKSERMNENRINNKINILKEFTNQSSQDFQEIDQIDLRWGNKVFIKKI